MKKISILGATGSIGTQALEVIKSLPNQFEIIALSSGRNLTLFQQQILDFTPQYACIANADLVPQLAQFVRDNNLSTKILSGTNGLKEICSIPQDLLVMAIVGTAGLYPTSIAIQHNTPIALACKEVLVSAGKLIMEQAYTHCVPIIPIDSEHAALKQCLASVNETITEVSRLILTASGGPFWNTPKSEFSHITKETALNHPNWDMGGKITIDSASMMNKGLEVIEAHFLFNIPYEKLDVIIHPQSIIHSLVEFTDGTMLSQMGLPDMRFPIQYALTYPKKHKNPWPKTPLSSLKPLTFHDPDYHRFPLLKIAFECGKKGQSYPLVMNAANEAAVYLFLSDKIAFTDITKIVEHFLSTFNHFTPQTIEEIISIDSQIKAHVSEKFH